MTTSRTLVVILAALGAVAVFSGVTGILLGPGFAPGGTEVAATVDSNFRFAYVFWLAAGLILWWTRAALLSVPAKPGSCWRWPSSAVSPG